jgi:glucan 1,3-beta-glucosidase
MIRSITGVGAGNGPYISIHDGFMAASQWAGYLPNSDRISLDFHPYFAFSPENAAAEPIATGTGTQAGGVWPGKACGAWGIVKKPSV